MKKALLIILGFGIVCSQLLSQELAVRFHFTDQPEQTEAAPEGTAFGSLTAPNQFNMRPNEPGLPRWLSVQSRDDLTIFGDAFRKAFLIERCRRTSRARFNSRCRRIRPCWGEN